MANKNREGPRIVSILALRVGQSTDSKQIARALAETWSEAEAALIPIIGAEGVAALLRRSIFLSSAAHAWFAALPKSARRVSDFGAVSSLIAEQPAQEALAGSTSLLLQFYNLLTSLIGLSLAERILETAWIGLSRGESAQDHSL
jgi:hypothetical protein